MTFQSESIITKALNWQAEDKPNRSVEITVDNRNSSASCLPGTTMRIWLYDYTLMAGAILDGDDIPDLAATKRAALMEELARLEPPLEKVPVGVPDPRD